MLILTNSGSLCVLISNSAFLFRLRPVGWERFFESIASWTFYMLFYYAAFRAIFVVSKSNATSSFTSCVVVTFNQYWKPDIKIFSGQTFSCHFFSCAVAFWTSFKAYLVQIQPKIFWAIKMPNCVTIKKMHEGGPYYIELGLSTYSPTTSRTNQMGYFSLFERKQVLENSQACWQKSFKHCCNLFHGS